MPYMALIVIHYSASCGTCQAISKKIFTFVSLFFIMVKNSLFFGRLKGHKMNLELWKTIKKEKKLTYDDIAKITNTALGTVKSRISRARLKLQSELKEFI